MAQELTIRELFYYCYQDEKHFFGWLESIPAVAGVRVGPKGLAITFKDTGLTRDDWGDLLGLFARYNLDMRDLRVLVTPEHAWLKEPQWHWHTKMWGD